ncbi:MAG TPA: hypothetical protein VKP30_04185 [Polyangiaceae bacterium]|jgi:hypothetical protein|nr:hypothetical protein [Polyangiaceae bacterium]
MRVACPPRVGRLTIVYDFEKPDGSYDWEEMSSSGIEAFTFTAGPNCTAEQIAAYDKLVEVTDSR